MTKTKKIKKLPHVCGVCAAPAPDHIHFGGERSSFLFLDFASSPGRTCFSCRAFFRRTVLRVARRGLKYCREGSGECEVTQSAKACIHCRYIKCLNIGMVPELVKGKRKKFDEREIEDQDDEEERETENQDDEKGSNINAVENNQDGSDQARALVTDKSKDKRLSVIRLRSQPTVELSISSLRQNNLSQLAETTANFPADLCELLQDNNFLHHCFTDPLQQLIQRRNLDRIDLIDLQEVLREAIK